MNHIFKSIVFITLTSIATHVCGQTLPKPKIHNNKVVAHRGGSMEKGFPDNSIEALEYAIDLNCYASECDVYLTKDEKIVVAHADNENKINGFFPWEATLAEIVAAGKLPNGEVIPSLEQYLDRVIAGGSTILWIDVKYISSLSKERADYLACKAVEVSSEIIRKKRAQNFVEFITPRVEVQLVAEKASKGDWACGLMDTRYSPDWFHENGHKWANFQNSKVFYHDGSIKGEHSIDDYLNRGISISVYHVDSELDRDYYLGRFNALKALTTNYPAALLNQIKSTKKKIND